MNKCEFFDKIVCRACSFDFFSHSCYPSPCSFTVTCPLSALSVPLPTAGKLRNTAIRCFFAVFIRSALFGSIKKRAVKNSRSLQLPVINIHFSDAAPFIKAAKSDFPLVYRAVDIVLGDFDRPADCARIAKLSVAETQRNKRDTLVKRA